MKRYEKEVIQYQLDSEKAMLKELEKHYKAAIDSIDDKIASLLGRNDANLQNVIFQVEHQKALKRQVEGILNQLHSNEFDSVSDYLAKCYESGFVGAMYSMHNQGVQLILPLDQKAVTKAVVLDSKISEGLYDSLGVDVSKLKKSIQSEITRGISAGMSYNEIARNISNATKAPLSRAKSIVYTEGHRVQQASNFDGQRMAKSKGAEVVKQWNSTLDGSTRDTHRRLDGQIREVDEPFEIDGMEAMFPGDFGDPAEDCNCRCLSTTRAKVMLDEDELQRLKDRAEFFGLDKTKDFEDFQKKYLNAAENEELFLRNNLPKAYNDERNVGNPISKEDLRDIMDYAQSKGVRIGVDGNPTGNFDKYCGDVKVLKEMVSEAAKQMDSELFKRSKAKDIILMYDNVLGFQGDNSKIDIGAFAMTKGKTITLNKFMFDDSSFMAKEYAEAVEMGFFAKGTDYRSVIQHEAGHIISKNTPGLHNKIMQVIEREANGSGVDVSAYIANNVSGYAAIPDEHGDYTELVSEINSLLNSGNNSDIIDLLRKEGVFQ